MSDAELLHWFPYVFPLLFAGLWLLISTLIGLMSGWYNLQQWYPDDGDDDPLLKLRGQSGMMGLGVSLNGCLTLCAYPSALGIRIWRVLGPFQKPLRIPWSEIESEAARSFLMPMVKLQLGKPANGSLRISARSWSKLVNAVPKTDGTTAPPVPATPAVPRGSVGRALLIQWIILSAIVSLFAYLDSNGQRSGWPALAYFAVPPVIFGIGQLIRFARS